jgi:hypothetical protein
MVDAKVLAALDAIEQQWNVAEAYVKRVERLRRGLVVTASINEFRYAGRRLIEAYALAKLSEGSPDKQSEALDYLREVKLFCLRAQHDAMDAAVTYVDQALAKFEDTFGPDLLHEKFPNYIPMKRALKEVSEVMANSRGDRALRDRLYSEIREDLVPTLIDNHHELETSTVVLEAAFKGRIKKERREAVRFWAPFVVAVATLLAAFFAIPGVTDRIGLTLGGAAKPPSSGVKPARSLPLSGSTRS